MVWMEQDGGWCSLDFGWLRSHFTLYKMLVLVAGCWLLVLVLTMAFS
jgi:hypothetical protein